jgi:ADP-ribose pyrophosphatase
MPPSLPLKFEKLQKESLYRGFFELNRYTFKHQQFAGGWSEPFQREIFERGHASAALLLDRPRERIVMVEQFRPGAIDTQSNPWLLEPVAGIIESGEHPEEVVKREALEEAGCQVGRLHKICEYLVSPGGSTERIWLYLAEIDSANLPQLGGLEHEQEDILIHQIPVAHAFDMLNKGQFNNAMSLIAIQWLKLNWAKIDEIWD